MLASGMLLIGTVDYTNDTHIRVEYKLGTSYSWIDVPVKTSICAPTEGMEVLFYKDGIVKCFCRDK